MTTRGDTTTYICQFDDDFDMSTVTSAVLAVSVYGTQGVVKLVKYTDCVIDIANKQIRRTFSQEESLALSGTVLMELIIMQDEERTSVSKIKAIINQTLVKEVIE